jgi:ankyrin repeat protein
VRNLLSKGANVNSRDNYGDTPLTWAAVNCHLEVVRLLLEKGADANSRNDEGRTALTNVRTSSNRDSNRCRANFPSIESLLIERGGTE